MLKTLIKKQLLQLNSFYFMNIKMGKRKSKASMIGTILLFLLIFGSVAFAFFGVSAALGDALINPGFMAGNSLEWLYFALIGLMSIALGTFGSVFQTYNSLYLSRDNDMLLAMPIPPRTILLSRIVGVYSVSLLYSALVWLPCVVNYWMEKMPTVTTIIFPILLLFVISLLVTVLCCILGWVIAIISQRLKNKSAITVILSLAFFFAYYFFIGQANELLEEMILNVDAIGKSMKGWGYPFYLMGMGAAGDIMGMLLFTLIVVALFLICFFVLAKSFSKILTMKKGFKKVEYQKEDIKTTSVNKALFKRELKRFLASPTYIMNAALGLFILPVGVVFGIIKLDYLNESLAMISQELPGAENYVPMAILTCVCLVVAMNQISVSSVSLEGKTLWIIRSLPVDSWEILHTKENLHAYLNSAVGVVCAVVFSLAMGVEFYEIIVMAATVWIFCWFTADAGLFLNLKHPNLNWTSEAAVIKQSLGGFIMLFGSWIVCCVAAVGCFLVRNFIEPSNYMILLMVVTVILYRITHRWLKTKGVEIFESL